jgi:capsular polysaccharide biosynthesis protein
MKAELHPVFGIIPEKSDNLQIVGCLPPRVFSVANATVWPTSGLIRWSNGSIENETLWVSSNLNNCGDYKSKWSFFPKNKKGKYFNVSLFWSGYYHWICDVLTRIHRIRDVINNEIFFILPSEMPAWKTRSLELLGINSNQCVQYFGKRPWKVESLLYASPVAMTGDQEETSLRWVRDTILYRVLGPATRPKATRKIYLARKNTWSRNLINEQQIIPLLFERGFEVIDCAQLSFDEQVRIFSEAICVIGPHGAGMTNILWAQPGLKVFEIFEHKAVRRCYWSMAKILRHHYYCGIGESVANEDREPNIYVTVDNILQAINIIDE